MNAKDEDGESPLQYAIGNGHKEIVELLIAKGADVNAKSVEGFTSLVSVPLVHKEILELLIANWSDVNAKDHDNDTPLLKAAKYGYKEIAERLIAKGADVNAKDQEFTATHR